MKVVFPLNDRKQKYYNKHASFVFRYAELAGLDISFSNHTDQITFPPVSFLLNGHHIVFHYGDILELGEAMSKYSNVPIFKFHYSDELHSKYKNVFPLGPTLIQPGDIDIYKKYFELQLTDFYNPTTDIVLNKQKIYGDAVKRRMHVHSLLEESKYFVDFHYDNKMDAWDKQKNCLVSVCVPGARNDMLDRGQLESFGLGVCTISPKIISPLMDENIIPGIHHVECAPDYSDLIKKLDWCKSYRTECKTIGNNAKSLFNKVYTPHKYWDYVERITNEFYGAQ